MRSWVSRVSVCCVSTAGSPALETVPDTLQEFSKWVLGGLKEGWIHLRSRASNSRVLKI